MYLNSLSGTNGYYYPGISDSGNRARNKHVGGFNDDEASSGNANAASQNTATNSANATNLTQYAPTATGAAQQSGSATDSSSSPSSTQQVSGTSASPSQSGISSVFAPEENILSSVIGSSLEAMGLASASDLANTNISFSSLSYGVESSVSAAAGQQGQQASAEVDESQSAELDGEGQITLANGTVYDFQIQLQVGNEVQASGSQTLGDSSNSSNSLAGLLGSGSDSTQGAQGTQAASGAGSDASGSSGVSSNYLAQLVSAMEQSASQAYATDPNSFLQQGTTASATQAASSGSQASSASSSSTGSTSSLPAINWDAIQKQTSSLIDMLNAITAANQSASSNAASNANAASASNAATAASSNTNNTTTAAVA